MQCLFDSNILIYHLNGNLNTKGTDLLEEGLAGEGAYSVISKSVFEKSATPLEGKGFERDFVVSPQS